MRGRPGPSWKVEVKAPPEAAYEYVADVGRHAEWASTADEMTIEPVALGPAKVGSRYKAEGLLLGKRNPSTVTITALEPPKGVEIEAEDANSISGHVFSFAPVSGGTVITRQIYAIKQPFLSPILFLLFKSKVDVNFNGALARLKENLEKSPHH
jgi:hypothetical protein